MKHILVIIKKQIKDTLKNKTVLIQFILFPLLTLIMENAVTLKDMPPYFFTKLFAVMYIGMAPFSATAAVLAEEKEKNTLRVLMMADVKPWEYLTGVAVYVWTICMLGAALMSLGLQETQRLPFLLIMGSGFLISVIAGACIGIFAKNQMMATSLIMPFMMIFSFAPMLSMFNETIRKFAAFVYTQQLKLLIDDMGFDGISKTGGVVLLASAAACVGIFLLAYRKKGLE